jgi:hypothetical protein
MDTWTGQLQKKTLLDFGPFVAFFDAFKADLAGTRAATGAVEIRVSTSAASMIGSSTIGNPMASSSASSSKIGASTWYGQGYLPQLQPREQPRSLTWEPCGLPRTVACVRLQPRGAWGPQSWSRVALTGRRLGRPDGQASQPNHFQKGRWMHKRWTQLRGPLQDPVHPTSVQLRPFALG